MKDLDSKIIIKAKIGDEQAIYQVLHFYKKLVDIKSKHFFLIGGDRDDICQEGMIGLLKAVKSYNIDKISSFKQFASICIQRQMISAITKANSKKNNFVNNAIDSSVNSKEEYIELYEKDQHNPEDSLLSKEKIKLLSLFLKLNLSEFEFNVYKLMLKEMDYKEISTKMDKNVKQIDNAIQRIRKKGLEWLNGVKYEKDI